MMSDRAKAAKEFAKRWKDKGYEKGDCQPFWLALLRDVFDISHPEEYITFEDQVHIDHTSFIDGYIAATRVMIEQKSLGKSLSQPIRQSDGALLTPFQQAKKYIVEMPVSKHPRYVITSNFRELWVYDMNKPQGEPEKILLEDLHKDYYRLEFLVSRAAQVRPREEEISIRAGAVVGKLYDAFAKQYAKQGKDPTSAVCMRYLNILCTRLVFCLYAENAGIFGHYAVFHDYLASCQTHQLRRALVDLFRVLDTPVAQRDPYLVDDNPRLAAFPYVNGGLFAEENIDIPPLTEELRRLLLTQASEGFNWADISPTIFGAVFESTLNPVTRRAGGMHYTSIENIHKVIGPLFLDSLRAELASIKTITIARTRDQQLRQLHDKLANIVILDPACGSGNFLTETYMSLRAIENDILAALTTDRQITLGGDFSSIRVTPQQCYGIEVNDFAVAVAKTALWIAEHQMMRQTATIIGEDLAFLPLKSYATIVEGNALQLDWTTIVPKDKLTYIIGNPPFVGYSLQSKEQKKDMLSVCTDPQGKPIKAAGKIDYVAGWYYKTARLLHGTAIRAALVSTNSITQGEQVAAVWQPLFNDYGIHIDFAYRTFRWDSESTSKAHVHCVIIGFSSAPNDKPKLIFLDDNRKVVANNINGYLVDAPDIFIDSLTNPICPVPKMHRGSQPTDDGNLILSEDEKDALIRREPLAAKFIRPYMTSKDFINRKPRYCLWLVDASPAEMRKCPMVLKRIDAVRAFRLTSKKEATRRKADTPMLFDENQQPDTNFLAIPEVSSEQRKYIPIEFLTHNIVVGNAIRIIEDATLYHFGVLTSNVHNAWMRAVGGRLKSDYRYSKDIVYNNFPWPVATEAQRARIALTAQDILDARALFPDSSLADLYDETTMPSALRRAHQANDRAVCDAYGWDKSRAEYASESSCVAALMTLYQQLTK